MKILVWGIGGRLGGELASAVKKTDGFTICGGFDLFANPANFDVPVFKNTAEITVTPDVIVDFTRHDAVYELLPYAAENKIPVVLCTTGHDEKDMEFIKKTAAVIPIFKTANMSLGINLLINLVKKAAAVLGGKFDVEIIEKHHNVKADAPSGTALSIAEAIACETDTEKEFVFGRHSRDERRKKNEIGIHAVRGGTVVGAHEVLFLGNDEIITISHEAHSKAVFAEGALAAARFIAGKPAGMYDMENLLDD